MVYVPFEDVNVYVDAMDDTDPKVDQFHLRLSENSLVFDKANQAKTIILTNVGWDNLDFVGVRLVNPVFGVTHSIPVILLPKRNYTLNIQYNSSSLGSVLGGLYIDVGDSYGDKFISLTGNII